MNALYFSQLFISLNTLFLLKSFCYSIIKILLISHLLLYVYIPINRPRKDPGSGGRPRRGREDVLYSNLPLDINL